MSLARRQYNARRRKAPQPIVDVTIDESCNWDMDAIDEAMRQAQQIEMWDQAAARSLMAQAQAARQRLEGAGVLCAPYDAMRTCARVLLAYQGGITDADLERMSYKRFFGYAREAEIAAEEVRDAQARARRGEERGMEALSEIPRPQTYTGETIRLV